MIDFGRLPDRTFLGKVLRLPLRMIPSNTQVPILQGPLRGSWWIVGSGVHGYWLGSYEKEQQQAITKLVRSGDVVLDIGANVGFYTLLASKLVGNPNGEVFAFEPLPRNVEFLKKHLELNRIQNTHILEVAVTDKSGAAKFDTGRRHDVGRVSSHGSLNVRTVRLDDLYLNGDIPAPNVIKMDIEGAEVSALKGAVRLLQECKPKIILSTHGPVEAEQSLGILKSLGFNCYQLGKRPEEAVFVVSYED